MKHISQKISACGGALLLTTLMLAVTDAGAADRNATGADVTINFDKVELTDAADAERLYHKLSYAARDVCGLNAGGFRTLEVRNREKICYKKVLADAVRKIDQPLLTALHQSKQGKPDKAG